jgi:hypothetical protein
MTVWGFLRAEWCLGSGWISIFPSLQALWARTQRTREPSHKRANCSVAAMILSVPGGKSGRNRFGIGPPRCGTARAPQVYTLRTSSEPCHCQFPAHNGDSWRIGPNIETYLLLLLSPSDPPHFSFPSLLPPSLLSLLYPSSPVGHYYKNIWSSSRRECIPRCIVAASRAQRGDFRAIPAERASERTKGETWNRIRSKEVEPSSQGLLSSRNLGAHALRLPEEIFRTPADHYIISATDPSSGSWSLDRDKRGPSTRHETCFRVKKLQRCCYR